VARPFNRANFMLDALPYETRGYYGDPPWQGGEIEHFSRETWIQRDICEKTPWPFPDKVFDFAVCSHTLEDVRDPLFVCEELMRVSKAGYIETPSRLAESCVGWESEYFAGLSHHRWLIDYLPGRLVFTPKYHTIHDPGMHLPKEVFESLSEEQRISSMFWTNGFTVSEDIFTTGKQSIVDFPSSYVLKMSNVIDFTSRGDRSAFAPLGWSQAEEWGAWSDGSEATISFRWPDTLKPPVFVSAEFFYAARADIVLLINGRVAGVLPGFPEHDMRWHTVPLQLIEEDTPRTSVLTFKPTATWDVDKRRLGIALNQIRLVCPVPTL
jgi:hypothetical protein